MGMLLYIAVVVAVLGVIFINYPDPGLTPKIGAWRKGGSYLNYKGYNIFYRVEEGEQRDGSALLIFHGFPTSSYDFIKVLPRLKKEFSLVILYDFLGFGLSDKPENHTYSIMEQADIGELILQKVGVTRVHLLSHDYGDTVALEFLARFNEIGNNDGVPVLNSLCLTNGGIFPETNKPRPVQKLLLYPYIGFLASRLSFFQVYSRGMSEIFGKNTVPTADEMWDFYVLTAYNKGYRIHYRLIQYITERKKHNTRWVGALKDTTVKVHMIYGPSDPVNPAAFIDFYKKTVPQHGITVLHSDIGHYPQWEDPDGVLEAYKLFIRTAKK